MILAHQVSTSLDLEFVIKTVNFLIENYKAELDGNVVIHSDQGCHYTSISYQELLKNNNITQSMSKEEIVGIMHHKNHFTQFLKQKWT